MLIPEENAKDLSEIPDNVKSGMTIVPVTNVREVLKLALVRDPTPIEWDEVAEEAAAAARQTQGDAAASQVAH